MPLVALPGTLYLTLWIFVAFTTHPLGRLLPTFEMVWSVAVVVVAIASVIFQYRWAGAVVLTVSAVVMLEPVPLVASHDVDVRGIAAVCLLPALLVMWIGGRTIATPAYLFAPSASLRQAPLAYTLEVGAFISQSWVAASTVGLIEAVAFYDVGEIWNCQPTIGPFAALFGLSAGWMAWMTSFILRDRLPGSLERLEGLWSIDEFGARQLADYVPRPRASEVSSERGE
ncbi:MAG: hypothetical protein ACREOA_00570 [Candidatus Dormibacteria bacterium]